MATISLCMIVRNEEKHLSRCLQSVGDLVDEIIIVDTGSTDRTKEIARQFTDKMFDFIWCDDFSAARNESLKHATSEWVLILDADETISPSDHAVLRQAVQQATSSVDGFLFTQRHYFYSKEDVVWGIQNGMRVKEIGLGEGFVAVQRDQYAESKGMAGWIPTPVVRLFRNKNLSFAGKVHEDATHSLQGEIREMQIPIHHFGKLDRQVWQRKKELYERLGLQKIDDADEAGGYHALFELAKQSMANNKIERAEELFEQAVSEDGKAWLAWFNLGSVCLLQDKLDKAIVCLKRAQFLKPDAALIYSNLGVAHARKKEFTQAISVLAMGLQFDAQNIDLYKNLLKCYKEIGDIDRAQRVLIRLQELGAP